MRQCPVMSDIIVKTETKEENIYGRAQFAADHTKIKTKLSERNVLF